MDKDILIQYADMREETKELRDRIERLEHQIEQMEKDGSVKDSVKGGNGGIQHFVIEGFPVPKHSKKVNSLKNLQVLLQIREDELLELLNQVEKYINTIKDSRMRRIVNLRVIENLTWQQVANRLDNRSTADGIRMSFERFINQ